MSKALLLDDLKRGILLLVACLGLGLIANVMRDPKFPLLYKDPKARLDEAVKELQEPTSSATSLGANVSKEEMRKFSSSDSVLILDARSKTLFALGHIPSAINVPRDEFKNAYTIAKPKLDLYRNKPIIVYCSDEECPNSQSVGETLRKLGYENVRVFRGGLDEWVGSNFPTKQGCNCGD